MPIKVQNDLPARAILESENIFVMDEKRALSQDIRPLQILILNLMPIKEETETQLLRALSNTPLQVDCTFLMMSTHTSKNTSASHLNKFYVFFDKNAKILLIFERKCPISLDFLKYLCLWTPLFGWRKSIITENIEIMFGSS